MNSLPESFDNDSDATNTNKSLHDLIWEENWDAAIDRIFVYEEEAKEKHGQRLSLPLHDACFLKAPHKFIEKLHNTYPNSTKVQATDGCLPLHDLFTVRINIDDDNGDIAIIDGLIDDATVRLLIESNPNAARTKDSQDLLPIHLAVGNLSLPTKSFSRLLATYPEAASIVDETRQSLLLSMACRDWPWRDDDHDLCNMLGELLKTNPSAIFVPDNVGDLPLHLIVISSWERLNLETFDAIKIIYEANLDAVNIPNERGDLPFHRICMCATEEALNNLHFELLSFLTKENPEAVRKPNNDGQLPLHLACIHWPLHYKTLLEKLVGANPHALDTVDNTGRTPLDYAMERESDSKKFVHQLFSMSSSGRLANLLGEMTVALAGAMVRVDSLEKHIQTLERGRHNVEKESHNSESVVRYLAIRDDAK